MESQYETSFSKTRILLFCHQTWNPSCAFSLHFHHFLHRIRAFHCSSAPNPPRVTAFLSVFFVFPPAYSPTLTFHSSAPPPTSLFRIACFFFSESQYETSFCKSPFLLFWPSLQWIPLSNLRFEFFLTLPFFALLFNDSHYQTSFSKSPFLLFWPSLHGIPIWNIVFQNSNLIILPPNFESEFCLFSSFPSFPS